VSWVCQRCWSSPGTLEVIHLHWKFKSRGVILAVGQMRCFIVWAVLPAYVGEGVSCDWTMMPQVELLRVERARFGAPTAWLLKDSGNRSVRVTRSWTTEERGALLHPCWDQTLHFDVGAWGGAPLSLTHAFVQIGSASTSIGSSALSSTEGWSLTGLAPVTDGLQASYAWRCPDGSLAEAAVTDEAVDRNADGSGLGWSRRVRLMRVCLGMWTHLAVNIVASPLFLEFQEQRQRKVLSQAESRTKKKKNSL